MTENVIDYQKKKKRQKMLLYSMFYKILLPYKMIPCLWVSCKSLYTWENLIPKTKWGN